MFCVGGTISGGQGLIAVVTAIVESTKALLPDRKQPKALFLNRNYVR